MEDKELILTDKYALEPVEESTRLLDVISRAVSDPRMDVSKMERLLAMHAELDSRTGFSDSQPLKYVPVAEPIAGEQLVQAGS